MSFFSVTIVTLGMNPTLLSANQWNVHGLTRQRLEQILRTGHAWGHASGGRR